MPLDLKREIVFVHIPKTAGTAIELALGIKPAGTNDQEILWGPVEPPNSGSKQHYTYREILDAKPHASSWPAFAVVRNPWDRMVSGWAHHPKWKKEVGSFKNFVHLAEKEVFDNGDPNWLDGYARVQYDFIRGYENKISVLRFEDLQEDFNALTAEIDSLGDIDVKLPRTAGRKSSTGVGLDYHIHYDDYLIKLVGELYKEDIDKFGYSFGQYLNG